MPDDRNHHLPNLLKKYADAFEFPCKQDKDNRGAKLGIPNNGQLIQAKYRFDENDDNYEWMAVIDEIHDADLPRTAVDIMKSTPKRGITERIIAKKLTIFGGRDNLTGKTDEEIESGFMDETSRISRYHTEHKNK